MGMQKLVLDILAKVGAVITDSHIVYTSGKHGSAYVNKDALYPHTRETSNLCEAIARQFVDDDVGVVVAPAIGGVILSQWVAHHLSEITGREVLGTYAEHFETFVMKSESDICIPLPDGTFDRENDEGEIKLSKGDSLIIRKSTFVIKRGYDKLVAYKNILAVEDVLTTGGSVTEVIKATRTFNGNVIGLGVLCNRGGITPRDVGDVPKLFSLVDVKLDAWDEADCPLCAKGIPINTDVGKGRQYLASKKVN